MMPRPFSVVVDGIPGRAFPVLAIEGGKLLMTDLQGRLVWRDLIECTVDTIFYDRDETPVPPWTHLLQPKGSDQEHEEGV